MRMSLDINEQIENYRKNVLGLHQAEMAEKFGLKQPAYNHYINSQRKWPKEILNTVVKECGLTLKESLNHDMEALNRDELAFIRLFRTVQEHKADIKAYMEFLHYNKKS